MERIILLGTKEHQRTNERTSERGINGNNNNNNNNERIDVSCDRGLGVTELGELNNPRNWWTRIFWIITPSGQILRFGETTPVVLTVNGAVVYITDTPSPTCMIINFRSFQRVMPRFGKTIG